MKGVAARGLRTISLTTSLMVGSKASRQTTFQGMQLKRKQSQFSEAHSLHRGPGNSSLPLVSGLQTSGHLVYHSPSH